MVAHVIPNIVYSPDDEVIPEDLSAGLVKGLEWLMVAQAQECSWQLAKLSSSFPLIIFSLFNTR